MRCPSVNTERWGHAGPDGLEPRWLHYRCQLEAGHPHGDPDRHRHGTRQWSDVGTNQAESSIWNPSTSPVWAWPPPPEWNYAPDPTEEGTMPKHTPAKTVGVVEPEPTRVDFLKPAQRRRVEALKEARDLLAARSFVGTAAPNPDDLTTVADYILEG